MDTYKTRLTKLQYEIFRLLCVHAGKKLNQRQIAKLLAVSPTAIANALPVLEKENLIKIIKSKEMNLNSIELNRDEKTVHLKRAENLKMIYETGLQAHLEERFPGATIILFGSFAKGEDTIDSDIDIAVIGFKEKAIDSSYEKRLVRKISVNNYATFKDIHKDLKDNICNGITLAGSIEL